MARRRKVIAFVFAPLILLLAGVVVAYDHLRAAAFIVQAAGMDGLAHAFSTWTTREISTAEITIPWREGMLPARLYTPQRPEGPAILIVPGVHAGGIDEPRMKEFASDVASMGRVVVTAELPDLKAYRITPRSTDMIEDAAGWLANDSGLAAGGRIGLIGISFAGGLAIVAAGRPSIRDRVSFVMSFGGHGDLPRTLEYLSTGRQPDGSVRPPHDYGVAIILLGVADQMVPAEQVEPLRNAILQFLQASHVDMVDNAKASIEFQAARDLAAALPEPAATLMGYVNERDVGQLGPLLLPHLGELAGDPALSPARAPVPRAPVYLLHGSDDNVIPAVESELLATRLRAEGVEVVHLSTPLITHAEVDRSSAAKVYWELIQFWASLFDER